MVDGSSAAIFVLAVALLNLIPVAYELIVSALQSCGFRINAKRLTSFSRVMNGVGNVGEGGLMIVVLCLIWGAIYLHVTVYYPFYVTANGGDYSTLDFVMRHLLPSVFLNSNSLFNFYKAIRTAPGTPNVAQASTQIVQGMRHCKFCKKPKPPRAHHCSTCGVCVLRMDHHCPFALNCIGKYNYHYFFLFIMYSFLSGVYATALSFKPYYVCEWSDHHIATDAVVLACREFGMHWYLMFFLSVFVALIIGAFWLWMAWMAWRGQTMNEFLNIYVWKSKTSLEYQRFYGSPRKNMEAFLGPMSGWWRWLIPFAGSPQLLDDTPL